MRTVAAIVSSLTLGLRTDSVPRRDNRYVDNGLIRMLAPGMHDIETYKEGRRAQQWKAQRFENG
jgi:hypothetical protein